MARIRSIHPGMMTDDDYMALSFAARICLAGVWMEADDHGVFEWKPLTLKARIFPADNVDMAAVLAELQTHSWVKQFPHDGKTYGVCKNFRKWQRPKKPHYVHPFPDEYGTYTGLKPTSSPPVPHQFSTASPIAPQREDVGGRMEDGEDEEETTNSREAEFQAWMGVYPNPVAVVASREAFNRARLKASFEDLMAAAKRYGANKPADRKWMNPNTFLDGERWRDGEAKAATKPEPGGGDDVLWSARMSGFDRSRFWNHDQWGPSPDQPGCKAPKRLLESRAA